MEKRSPAAASATAQGSTALLLAMVGVINVIIVKYSVEWVQTLHQGSTLKLFGESTINPAMKYPLLISMLGLWLLYAVNVLMRARTEVMWRERRSKWVAKLVTRPEKGEQ